MLGLYLEVVVVVIQVVCFVVVFSILSKHSGSKKLHLKTWSKNISVFKDSKLLLSIFFLLLL